MYGVCVASGYCLLICVGNFLLACLIIYCVLFCSSIFEFAPPSKILAEPRRIAESFVQFHGDAVINKSKCLLFGMLNIYPIHVVNDACYRSFVCFSWRERWVGYGWKTFSITISQQTLFIRRHVYNCILYVCIWMDNAAKIPTTLCERNSSIFVCIW